MFDTSKGMQFNETAIRSAFSRLNLLVRPKNLKYDEDEIAELTRAMDVLNITIPELMQQLMHPCDRMIRYCIWKNKLTPCTQIFHVVQSTLGYCCTFNYATK